MLETVWTFVLAHQEALLAGALTVGGWLLSKLAIWKPKKVRLTYKAIKVLHNVWGEIQVQFATYFDDPTVTWDSYVNHIFEVLKRIEPKLAEEVDQTLLVAEVTKELIAEQAQ